MESLASLALRERRNTSKAVAKETVAELRFKVNDEYTPSRPSADYLLLHGSLGLHTYVIGLMMGEVHKSILEWKFRYTLIKYYSSKSMSKSKKST